MTTLLEHGYVLFDSSKFLEPLFEFCKEHVIKNWEKDRLNIALSDYNELPKVVSKYVNYLDQILKRELPNENLNFHSFCPRFRTIDNQKLGNSKSYVHQWHYDAGVIRAIVNLDGDGTIYKDRNNKSQSIPLGNTLLYNCRSREPALEHRKPYLRRDRCLALTAFK